MKGAKERAKEFQVKSDGTYDAKTGKEVLFPSGYQFSFVRKEAWELSGDDWDFLTEYLKNVSHSEEYIGVYCGEVETSFYTEDKNLALHYAKLFNQDSILDWEKRVNIDNPDFWFIWVNNDSTRRVDYDEIIKSIRADGKKI